MTASNWADQGSENNTLFSHSKQHFCGMSDLANSCLIIYCHRQRHDQQTEFGDTQISCFQLVKQKGFWYCMIFIIHSLLWFYEKKIKISLFYVLKGQFLSSCIKLPQHLNDATSYDPKPSKTGNEFCTAGSASYSTQQLRHR